MRHLYFLLLLVGCAGVPTPVGPSTPVEPSGFTAVAYNGLSSLNLDPPGTAMFLFRETCDIDFHTSISPVGSDGLITVQNNQSLYRYYQTYHDVLVWGTKIEVLWDNRSQTPIKGNLLIVDDSLLRSINSVATIPASDALTALEKLFLAADDAASYDIAEPMLVYYFCSTTHRWHYGWESMVIAHHPGYDPHTSALSDVNLVYFIIIDGISGEQLLLEFELKN